MASQAQTTQVGGPQFGERGWKDLIKNRVQNTQGLINPVIVQLLDYARKDFDRLIGTPEQQFGRLSRDAGGFKTYLSDAEYKGLNPVEQIFCRPASSSTGTKSQGKMERICYICGDKLIGKDAIRRGYNDTERPQNDWKYPQIEHVMNMAEGTAFGVVTPQKIKKGEYLKNQVLDPPGLRNVKLSSEDKLKTAVGLENQMNLLVIQFFEYLWSHLLCNQVKGDLRFVRVRWNTDASWNGL